MSDDEKAVADKASHKKALEAMVEMTVDGWRFSRLFIRMMNKLDVGEQTRFINNLNYFVNRLNSGLEQVGLKLVNLEGHPYDTGMAATPINIADFEAEDELMVEQMVEPVIMNENGLVRAGTVMLRKIVQ